MTIEEEAAAIRDLAWVSVRAERAARHIAETGQRIRALETAIGEMAGEVGAYIRALDRLSADALLADVLTDEEINGRLARVLEVALRILARAPIDP